MRSDPGRLRRSMAKMAEGIRRVNPGVRRTVACLPETIGFVNMFSGFHNTGFRSDS